MNSVVDNGRLGGNRVHTNSCTSRMNLALAAIEQDVSGVPCLNSFSSLFQLSSCKMRQIQIGDFVYERSVGNVVSVRDMLHI